MFKLFKKALAPKVDEQAIIAEIHNEFDSAGERLLKEAKAILSKEVDIDKGERLKNIGFTAAKDAVSVSAIIEEKKKSTELANLIEYYQQWYPNNKFITDEVVKEICKKYNLLFGDSNRYNGSIPDKNITEIESFVLRVEDMVKRSNLDDYFDRQSRMVQMQYISQLYNSSIGGGFNNPKPKYESAIPNEITYRTEKPPFKICAPESDFDTRGMQKDGHELKLIPDPIVLQPVKGGYLIISKWGFEASDSSLTNEKLN